MTYSLTMISGVRRRWGKTTLGRASRFIGRKDQRKILLVIAIQILLSLMDLVGVALVGILGAIAVSGVESQKPGGRIEWALTTVGIAEQSLTFQAVFLGLSAATLLLGRSILTVYFSRKTMKFLSRRGAQVSSNLISRLLRQDLIFIQAESSQKYLYSVTSGVTTIVLGVLGTLINLVSDLALMFVMGIGLFFVDPAMALGSLVLFGFIVSVLYKYLHIRVKELGISDAQLSVAANEKIVEVLSSYRESVVRNSRDFYAKRIANLKFKHADILAELSFLPSISKYVIEAAIVIGALFIGVIQFAKNDATNAVATIAIFMAAGTRIAPAILRIQQGALQIKGSLGSAEPTLKLFESLNIDFDELKLSKIDFEHLSFEPHIEISNLHFAYPEQARPALQGINLEIFPGETVAIVGPSGSGKTTLVDVMLGILNPSEGKVEIGKFSPLDAISKFPGGIAYVPQATSIFDTSIRNNIGTGFDEELATDELIWKCLRIANLEEVVLNLPETINTEIGENGTRLSGGQRQRLGIARAFFTNPKLLVLDEATSALDGVTEAGISEEISKIKGTKTVILIAHRLSTVRNADKVVYLSDGQVRSVGTFNEVRNAIPDFADQAKLMGL